MHIVAYHHFKMESIVKEGVYDALPITQFEKCIIIEKKNVH